MTAEPASSGPVRPVEGLEAAEGLHVPSQRHWAAEARTGPHVTARVYGIPVTQGSARAFVRGNRAVVTSANTRLKPWREAVRSTLVDQLPDGWAPIAGPVAVYIAFMLPKPASAPKRRRTWPIGARSGDLDKLIRAIFDAATDAGVWGDDAQAVCVTASKDYGDRPGAEVTIYPMERAG